MIDPTTLTRLREIISDDEIARVHGRANFGSMTPREVVNDGVLKYAVGYQGGHTQFLILREHGLITAPRRPNRTPDLTKKGKRYARILYDRLTPRTAVPEGVWDNPIYQAADEARTRWLRDVDCNDQMGALAAAITAALAVSLDY